MRGYHFKVALLAFGVLLGYGSAFARYQAGHGLWGHGCWGHGHHGHHAHYDHHACEPHTGSGVHSKAP
jgi:hypothetical protein